MPINYDKLREVVNAKIEEIIKNECERYGIENFSTDIEIGENFIFAVSHTNIKSSKGMHRYGIYCFSALGFELYYKDSNVCDKTHKKTISDAKRNTKNFFNHTAKELNAVEL